MKKKEDDAAETEKKPAEKSTTSAASDKRRDSTLNGATKAKETAEHKETSSLAHKEEPKKDLKA